MTNRELPYSDIFFPLLKSIHNGLAYCYLFGQNPKKELAENDPQLKKLFSPFEKWYKLGTNKHISKGLSKKDQQRYHIFPRLSKLTIQAFKEAQEITKDPNFKGLVLPSPLSILYQALTVPSEPQTSSYPLVLCRSMMFSFFQIHPQHNESLNQYKHLSQFDEKSVLESIASFRNHIRIQARWPDKRADAKSLNNKVHFLVGHILSMKGITHLWFSTKDELLDFCTFNNSTDYRAFIDKYKNPSYRFRLAYAYSELPPPGEVVNLIFGVPLPFRGADILFFGGIKKTAKGGIVVSVSGKPGAGKTSVALSIGALLSPFNTKCIYISLEEEPQDLYKRLVTLIPEHLKELSIYKDPSNKSNKWFFPYKINTNIDIEDLTVILHKLKMDLETPPENDILHDILPHVCSKYIVIDNINELAEDYTKGRSGYDKLEKLIAQCRDMGAIVLMISAHEVPDKLKLDYLVDVAITIKQTGTDTQMVKPIRIFQLNKTRHQVSRQGSHVFHLTGPAGFRICPQTPSQMDKKEILKRLLPDKSSCVLTLNLRSDHPTKPKPTYDPYLKIFPVSQILVHGFGSTGKAGFALKILLTPPIKRPTNKRSSLKSEEETLSKIILKGGYSRFVFQRKVLIISFLYPQEYYEELAKKISSSIKASFPALKNAKIIILPFFPGYLTPEDFINKIVRYLDEAILEGEPYTGVLLDGLHNVFLQFKNLQENDMVWPLLYGILSRYKITVVSTFTNFSLSNKRIDANSKSENTEQINALFHQSIEDQRLMQKGQTPFLHSLVKASDFYLLLEEVIDANANFERKYLVSVRSAIDQAIPRSFLEWDRQNLYVLNKFEPRSLL